MQADINNVQLSAPLMAALYPRLIITGSTEAPGATDPEAAIENETALTANTTIKSLGGNQRQITILVTYPEVQHLPEPVFDYLVKILDACKLTINDVAIVNTYNHPQVTQHQFTAQLNSRIFLLFGVNPLQHGFADMAYFSVQQQNNATVLYATSLNDIEHIVAQKKQLWPLLQHLFLHK